MGVFIVNFDFEHILHFLLVFFSVGFEQVNACCVLFTTADSQQN